MGNCCDCFDKKKKMRVATRSGQVQSGYIPSPEMLDFMKKHSIVRMVNGDYQNTF